MTTDSAGNIYVADGNPRIQEIPVSSHTQFGISMTAGDVYTIAGDAHGAAGSTGNGGPATSALLEGPTAVAVDASGNVYIADSDNNVIREIAATNHTQFGITMTAGDIYGIAGNGSKGFSGDGGLATAAELSLPAGIAVDPGGDVLIADEVNNRVQEVASTSHTQFGITMTAAHIYTVAGSAAANVGTSGDGGAATSALLSDPSAVALDSAGDLYIDDSTNSRVQEVYEGGQTWGQSMTVGDIYTIARQFIRQRRRLRRRRAGHVGADGHSPNARPGHRRGHLPDRHH